MRNIFHGSLKHEENLYLNIEYFKDTTKMYNFYKYFSAYQDQKFFHNICLSKTISALWNISEVSVLQKIPHLEVR
jgi:hypothetical protein